MGKHKYYIAYIDDGFSYHSRYELCRSNDGKVLCSDLKLEGVLLYCLGAGITKDEVIII